VRNPSTPGSEPTYTSRKGKPTHARRARYPPNQADSPGSVKPPSERDGLPIGGTSASNNTTIHDNYNTTLAQVGHGPIGTSGRGDVSGAAGHQADESPRGYAGGTANYPSIDGNSSPCRRAGGRRPTRRTNPTLDNEGDSPEERRANTALQTSPNRTKKNTRANIRIATLNVQGRGSNSLYDSNHKWHALNRMIISEKIGIFCAQETHLTEEQTEAINDLHKNIKVFSTIDPTQPNSKGVAIAINKKITNAQQAKTSTLIPGRALLLEIPWHANELLTVLAVYAPNDGRENRTFWENLNNIWERDVTEFPLPDVLLGDFNMVEDPIDRSSGTTDPIETVNSLSNLKTRLALVDGWRQTFPHEKNYTLQHRSNNHRSRIDRIYATTTVLEMAEDWQTKYPPIQSDHKMVTVKIAHTDAPHLGRGRWSIPHRLYNNRPFLKDIEAKGKELLAAAKNIKSGQTCRSATANPQKLWDEWKTYVIKTAKDKAKKKTTYLDKIGIAMENEIRTANNDNSIENPDKSRLIAELEQRRKEIESEKVLMNKQHSNAQFRLEGETVSSYWIRLNRTAKPRDTFKKLKKPVSCTDPNIREYETRSAQMAELAKHHHNKLQTTDLDPDESPQSRENAIDEVSSLQLPKLPNSHKNNLAKKITLGEIETALAATANRKAAGLDGITYEIYKKLGMRHSNLIKEGRVGFDVPEMMALVFNDIAEEGLCEKSKLNEGWMCPIYKKNDKMDIANYRPITVLNTDYKLMAKVLQAKLATAAPVLIHQNQAGFMKGRSIFDHIKTIQAVTEYAETMDDSEWNGLIVALDQEKAYDKIRHDYLWEILKTMNLPNRFINTIRELYKGAKTQVMINGFLSETYDVTRGVRQGDPLSCLLFNLAIEPLAIMIRNSQLEGLKIPRLQEKLKALLFADDTTVFLSNKDSLTTLMEILDKWCKAAGAKFNKNKTEIIPYGSPEYRSTVKATRKINEAANTIPDGIKINAEGEPTRILGAWFGDHNNNQPWTMILDKTASKLREWKKSCPTLEGTRLINWMENMSSSQFLTKAQGMPPEITNHFEKLSKEFTWDSPRAKIRMTMMTQPIGQGGRKIPDTKTRNLAIETTDLKSFLDQKDKRIWTYILEDNMRRAWDDKLHAQDDDPRINPLIQQWPRAKSKRKLTKMAKKILETAKKTDLRIEVDQVSEKLKKEMPIWYHPALKQGDKLENNSPLSKHLRRKHNIYTVGEAATLASLANHDDRKDGGNCHCNTCSDLEVNAGCKSLEDCIRHAKKLIGKISDTWRPKLGLTITLPPKKHTLCVPASTGCPPKEAAIIIKRARANSINDIFRILRKNDRNKARQQPEDNLPRIPRRNIEIAYTDGSCDNNGFSNAASGSGVHFPKSPGRDLATKVPGTSHSNQIGEIYAITRAVQLSDPESNLVVISDSDYAIKSLSTRLTKAEDHGWSNTKIHLWIKEAIEAIRNKRGEVALCWTKAHVNENGNERADTLAKEGANKPSPDWTTNKAIGRISGLKLSTITQSVAYRAIMQENQIPELGKVTNNLHRIQNDMKTSPINQAPNHDTIWKDLKQSKNIYRTQREFLFKAIKNIHQIGSYWSHIPNYEQRATCQTCDKTESMEHILTECQAPGQEEIWKETGRIWELKGETWIKPAFGVILGCASAKITNHENKTKVGQTRLYQILLSEAAYKIWSIRCKRVISNDNDRSKWPSETNIVNDLRSQINLRLRMDCLQTNEQKFERKALSQSKATATWKGLLKNEEFLPEKWASNPGVLVGIR
jgi:ribonuclease HI/exonuclease III